MNTRIVIIAWFLLILGIPSRAQWVQTGPYGGDISALAVSGSNLFACGESGVYCSTDNGNSWKLLPGSPAGAVAFAVSGSNLFAGYSGLYRSTDNGESWAASGLSGYQNVRALAMIGTTIFAGTTDSGIFRSTDNGASWIAVDSGVLTGVGAFAVIGSNIFMSAGGAIDGIFLSTDYGESWTETIYNFSPALLTAMGTNLFAGGNGVYRSTDNGTNWKEVKSGLTDTLVTALAAYGTTLFAGTLYDGVFRSTDSGASWTEVSVGLPVSPYVQAFAESGTNLFSSVYGLGAFRSSDTGTSWKSASKGLAANSVIALVTDGTNLYGVEVGGASSGISLSTDSGATWNLVDPSLIEGITALAVSGSNLYAANGILYLTTDHGMSWTMDTGLTTVNVKGNYDVSAIGVFGTDLFVGLYGDGILRSTNGGLNWSSTDSGLPAGVIVSLFTKIGTKLFAGTPGNGVYLSTNNGTSWAAAGLSDAGGVNAIAVSGTNLFAATGNVLTNGGVFRSTDSGTSWTVENTGLPPYSIVSVLAVYGTSIFAGVYQNGVFLSTNNGESWTSVGLDSIGADVGITGFAIIGLNLYAATGIDESNEVDAGVWRRPLSDFGISSVQQTAPMSHSDIQICPNPFSQSTQITFTSQAAGYAEVSIVNMLGVEVAGVFSGELGAGEHSIAWSNTTGLTDGMYECLVRMNGQVQTLPVVLMR